jgi:hypothetical protein
MDHRCEPHMFGSVLSLLGSLVMAPITGYCVLVAYSMVNPVPIPSAPREVPILTWPADDDRDDEDKSS